jgi:hypothetical protein
MMIGHAILAALQARHLIADPSRVWAYATWALIPPLCNNDCALQGIL